MFKNEIKKITIRHLVAIVCICYQFDIFHTIKLLGPPDSK